MSARGIGPWASGGAWLLAVALSVAVLLRAREAAAQAPAVPAHAGPDASGARPSAPPAGANAPSKTPRPYDAPRVETARAHIPPLPPEYLTHDEGWIRLSYHPSARERVRPLIEDADAIRNALAAELGREVLRSVEVRVAAVPAEMARLAPGDVPSYAPALAYGELHLVVMSLSSPISLEPPDLEEVFRHGLAHLALDEALGGASVPRWFAEGYAVHASGEDGGGRVQALAVASLRQRLLGVRELESSFPDEAPQASIAFAEAADLCRFLLHEDRRDSFPVLMERLRAGEPFEQALTAAYAADLGTLEQAWRRDMARRYSFAPVLAACGGLWLLLAGIALVRRRRRRTAAAARETRRARRTEVLAARARDRARPPRALTIGDRLIEESDELGEAILPDPEVPKVEHDGRWHTLH